MFTAGLALDALYYQKSQLKFTAVFAELHSARTRPEQITEQYHNSLLRPNSPQKRQILFVFSLWDRVPNYTDRATATCRQS
jgi:hypothetical protein